MGEVLIALLAAPVAAFALGAVVRGQAWRRAGLIAALAAPAAVYTWWLAAAPASDGGFGSWWATGLVVAAIPFTLSALATIGGFLVGRMLARSLS